jgi:hypothetical protein
VVEGEFKAEISRGRRLDKAKIKRWRKREETGAIGFQTRVASSPGKLAILQALNEVANK